MQDLAQWHGDFSLSKGLSIAPCQEMENVTSRYTYVEEWGALLCINESILNY